MYVSIALIVLAYVIGSIPFGLIIGKVFYRADIREHGSKNIGATNAYRTLGLVAGISVLLADFLKGFVPVLLAKSIVRPDLIPLVGVLTGIAAIAGHSYSIFLRFSGGKSISTAAGFIFALWPVVLISLLLIWIVIVAVTRYVSVASIVVAVMLPILVTIIYPRTEYTILTIIVAILLVYRHRSNIARLLAGNELKIGQKPSAEED